MCFSLIFRRSREVVAFLKVGWKRLLLLDDTREVHDVMTPSILDFCVRAHYRRRGVGRKLFDWYVDIISIYEPLYLELYQLNS